MRYHAFLLGFLVAACGDSTETPDAGASPDAAADAVADTSAPDAGADDAGADVPALDAGPGEDAGPETVEALVLTGHLARRMLSCDRGETFVYDVSYDDDARCWDMDGGSGPDCDHHPTSNNGVTYGNGVFVTTAGWGPSTPEDSGLHASDGSAWEQVVPEITYNGIAFGNGVFIANHVRPMISRDGLTWTEGPQTAFTNSRGAEFANIDGGIHVLARNNLAESWFSTDSGESFWQAEDVGHCDDAGNSVTSNGERLAFYSTRNNALCVSTNAGATWELGVLPEAIRSPILWNGEVFVAWGGGTRFTSIDLTVWQEEAGEGPSSFQHLERFDDGTLIGVVSSWGSYYSGSGLYRSDDEGLTWQAAGASDALNGHPIRGAAIGRVALSVCE